MALVLEATAKLNLSLEVLGERADGYHALRSFVIPISLTDSITLEESTHVTCDSGYDDDLMVKAVKVLWTRFPHLNERGLAIHLEKKIPVGGGLGGGSADAAAVLRGLNRLWELNLPLEKLAEIGADVGSDVPALILAQETGQPVLMEGRGEKVSLFADLPSQRFDFVLVNPGIFASTPKVFKKLKERVTNDPKIVYNIRRCYQEGNPRALARVLMNDLAKPACELYPEIGQAEEALRAEGVLGTLMSGSGATVFGLVDSPSSAHAIAERLTTKGLWATQAHTIVR